VSETLNEIERRVLGALLEKSLAQPQYYPMTLNAIVAACNQKSNREPILELDDEAVWNTLEVLRAGGLVSRLLPGGASRVERFKHEVKERFGWEKPQRAVMTELLLRGPQTIGELRGHCARLYPFDTADAVTAVVENLVHADPPRIASLPRQAGQAAVRFAHCLYADCEWAALAKAGVAESVTGGAPEAGTTGSAPSDVQRLEAALTDIRVELAALARRVAAIEGGKAD
jgi:uncharacterized protein